MGNKQLFLPLLLHPLSCGTQEVTVLVSSSQERPVCANARGGTVGTLATKTAKRLSVLKTTRGANGQNIGKQTEAVHIVRSVKKTLIGDKPLSKGRLVGLSTSAET